MAAKIPPSGSVFPPARHTGRVRGVPRDVELRVRTRFSKGGRGGDSEIRGEGLRAAAVRDAYSISTVSKLALILKTRADGTVKKRIVVDMLRSGGNSRITLLRVPDVLGSVRKMDEWEPPFPADPQCTTEFVLVDLADAFCHFAVTRDELQHCRSIGDGQIERGFGQVTTEFGATGRGGDPNIPC